MIKKIVFLSVLLISSFFLLRACALGQADRSGTQGVSVGKEAPDFTLKDLDGKNVSLKGFRGSPVLLVFWANWCPACLEELPHLNKFHDDYVKKGLVILGVHVAKRISKAAAFAKQEGIKYTIALDSDNKVSDMYGVFGIPTNVLIDKRGIVRYKNNPIPERAEIEKLL